MGDQIFNILTLKTGLFKVYLIENRNRIINTGRISSRSQSSSTKPKSTEFNETKR